jgi:peptidoglycan/LPS O-acetylase OafA/YrhL
MPVFRFTSYYLVPGLRGQLMMMLHTGSDAIFSGCLLAICMARFPELCRKLLAPWWVILLLALFFFRGSAFIVHHSFRGYEIVIGTTLLIGAIFITMLNLLLQERETWYHWILGLPPLVYLGRISYSVYLWQQMFLTGYNPTVLGKWPFNLLSALVVGWLSYRFIEIPFVQLKDKYFPAHTKPAPASSSA